TSLNLYYIDCSYNYIADKNDVIGFSETWDTGNYHFSPQHQEGFFAATGIINLPTTVKAGDSLTLSGTVVPSDATNKTITGWFLDDDYANETGASFDGNVFKAISPGTAYLIAVVRNGQAENEDFAFWFRITVAAAGSDPPVFSGGGGGGGTSGFTVKFETNGGSTISSATIPSGGKLTKPTDPTKTGYVFAGWHIDKELLQAYDFEKTVTIGFTLYAKWTEAKTEIENKAPLPFTDVSKSNWFYDNVAYVYENGLMLGTSDDKFSPNLTLTRGMVVTVLYRLTGEPDTAGLDNAFSDIGNTWYTNAIKWASENDIVTGYGNGKFGPNDNITREQMAAILFRYIKTTKMSVDMTNIQYVTFADETQISDYAMDAIQALYKLGIIQGVGENNINPKGDATRAQFAAMVHRMQKLVE
ncbi:MAG: S-layer homology domain-containing protein, partial [Clostridiales bacterium]|nr:S-layer homology domain-containing protein [Clostridiales bacterium]